jgi:hypothetical protein
MAQLFIYATETGIIEEKLLLQSNAISNTTRRAVITGKEFRERLK